MPNFEDYCRCPGCGQCAAAKRKPLTDEQIWWRYQVLWPFNPFSEPTLASDIVKFARAIERAHGIGDSDE